VLLNQEETRQFLLSMTFPDSKRPFTKGVLSRINLFGLLDYYPVAILRTQMKDVLIQMEQQVDLPDTKREMRQLLQPTQKQLRLF
jgi:hypothetical protein